MHDHDLLTNGERIHQALEDALIAARFTCVSHVRHDFADPAAVTSVHVLAESHLVAHTWPEHDLLLVDVFVCSTLDHLDHFLDVVVRTFSGRLLRVSRERTTI